LQFQEEEEERSDRWSLFLERQAESTELAQDKLVVGDGEKVLGDEVAEPEADPASEKGVHEANNRVPDDSDSAAENGSQKEVPASEEAKVHRIQLWTEIRPTLRTIEDMMSVRVKKKTGSVKEERIKKSVLKDDQIIETEKSTLLSDDVKSPKGVFEEDSEEEYYDVERSDPSPDMPLVDGTNASANGITTDAAPPEASFPWKEELEVLVRGGVPMALRGEVCIIYLRFAFLVKFIYFWLVIIPFCLLLYFSFGKLLLV